jgi:spore coat protein U-like protein
MNLGVLAVLLVCLLPGLAQALDFCRVNTLPVNFGRYDAGSPVPLDSVGTMRVACLNLFDPGGGWVTQIGGGNSGDPAARWMSSGAERLDYNLYVDLPRTRVWGDGTGGTETVARTVSGIIDRTSVPIYGRVPGGRLRLRAATGTVCSSPSYSDPPPRAGTSQAGSARHLADNDGTLQGLWHTRRQP